MGPVLIEIPDHSILRDITITVDRLQMWLHAIQSQREYQKEGVRGHAVSKASEIFNSLLVHGKWD